jgi:hypothetical protein
MLRELAIFSSKNHLRRRSVLKEYRKMTVEQHNVSTTALLEVSSEDRYGFKADIAAIGFHVRFTPKSGHSAALPMIFVRALCTASQQNGSADVRFGSKADMAL